MLKFDVNSKPPSQTAIDTEINKLNKDMLSYFKKGCILALLVIVIGLIILNQCGDDFATLWNLAVETAKDDVTPRPSTITELIMNAILFLMTCILASILVPLFMISTFVDKVINPIKQIKMQLFSLNSFNNLKLIEELANASPIARDYLKQLGDINRHITRLEFNLLKEGSDKASMKK